MSSENNIKPGALHEIQKILEISEERKFKMGEVIFEEGAEDSNFYIILKGDIEISKKTTEGNPKVIAELEVGEFLGEGILSGATIKPASAKAITETVLMAFSYENFEKLVQEDSKVAVDFLLSVVEAVNSRLAKTNVKLMTLYEINQLMGIYRDDLMQLSSGLINKLMNLTDSKAGILFIKNPFTTTYRILYTSTPDLNEDEFSGYELDKTQKINNEKGQFVMIALGDLGSFVLKRDLNYTHYDDDQIRLLVLVAEQMTHTIKEASIKASEKAKKMLERKRFEM